MFVTLETVNVSKMFLLFVGSLSTLTQLKSLHHALNWHRDKLENQVILAKMIFIRILGCKTLTQDKYVTSFHLKSSLEDKPKIESIIIF